MKRIVLIFGILSGLVSCVEMSITMPFMNRGFLIDYGWAIGYAAMVLAFVFVFFGIRAYRDNNGGSITFGRAFVVGILITLISCACYIATWEVIYYNFMPDFVEKYTAHIVQKMEQKGATAAEIASKREEMAKMAVAYRNPLINVAMTFIEAFPVGLIMTLVSAALLRKREPEPATAIA